MAQTLENLVIEIKAKNAEIVSKLDQADKRLQAFERSAVGRIAKIEASFEGLGRGLQRGFALLSSAAALGGLTHLVKGSLEAADNIGDLSTKLGISTTDLQQFQFVAKLSGVEAGTLDSALVKLNVSIAQSADQNSKAAEAFQQLEINIRDFSSNGDVFAAVMDRIGKSQISVAQQTEILRTLMGKSAAALRVMAQEFAELRQNAPFITEEDIRNAAKLNDEWDTMTAVVDVKLTSALIKLGPVIESLIGLLGRAAEGIGLLFERAKESARELTLTDLKATIKQLEILQKRRDEPGFFDRVFGDSAALEKRIQDAKTHAHELQQELSDLTPGGPKPPTKPKLTPLEDLVGEDRTKPKRGKRGPDFESIFNRFAEEAARTEASLQERIATITGDVTQLQITALAEVEARRQTSIHQAKGAVLALAQIEKTAALEKLGIQLQVIEQLNDADKQQVQDAEDAARRKLDTIQAEAEARRSAADVTLDSIRLEQDLADSQGAPLQRLIDLRQQEAEAIRAAADAEVEAGQKRASVQQQQMRDLKELLDARKLLVQDITAARDSANTDLEKGLQEARLIELNRALQETQDKYDAIARSVQAWGSEQQQIASRVTDSLARIAEEQRRATAPISERVFERLAVDARGSADRVADAWVNAMDTAADALTEFTKTGKVDWKNLLLSMEDDLLRTLNRELFHKALNELLGIGQEGAEEGQTGGFRGLLATIFDASFPTPQRPLQQPTAGPAISGPFEVSSLSQQVEGLQVPLLQASTAGIQQLTLAGTTATQTLTQASTASLTSIQTTSTTAISSIQQVTTTALAAIQQAAAVQGQGGFTNILGGGGNGGGTDLSGVTFTPGTDLSSVPFVIPPETFTPLLTSFQATGQQVTQSVGQTGQSVITQTGSMGNSILSQIAQFAASALTQLLTAATAGSGGSGGGGFLSMFSSLFSSFGGMGGGGGGADFSNVISGSSSTAAIIPVAHSGGIIGKTVLPTRAVSPAVFTHAPRFHEGLKALQAAQIAQHFIPVLHEGTMSRTTPTVRPLPDAAQPQERLKPDEFPAILQTGETVLSRSQVKEIRTEISKASKPGRQGVVATHNLTKVLAPLFHTGGTVGRDAVVARIVPTALFSGAPRLHDGLPTVRTAEVTRHLVSLLHEGAMAGNTPPGRAMPDASRPLERLKPDEFPAILQTGETVLSRSQVKEVHREIIKAREPATQEAALGALIRIIAPVFHAGGTIGGSSVSVRTVPAALFTAAPRFHEGMLSKAWEMPQTTEPLFSAAQVGEVRQQSDIMPMIGEASARRRGEGERPINITFNGVTDMNSFRRNEQQVQAAIARSTARASRKNN